jgi:hypothetical protein
MLMTNQQLAELASEALARHKMQRRFCGRSLRPSS